jgi:hypothetical protein
VDPAKGYGGLEYLYGLSLMKGSSKIRLAFNLKLGHYGVWWFRVYRLSQMKGSLKNQACFNLKLDHMIMDIIIAYGRLEWNKAPLQLE